MGLKGMCKACHVKGGTILLLWHKATTNKQTKGFGVAACESDRGDRNARFGIEERKNQFSLLPIQ